MVERRRGSARCGARGALPLGPPDLASGGARRRRRIFRPRGVRQLASTPAGADAPPRRAGAVDDGQPSDPHGADRRVVHGRGAEAGAGSVGGRRPRCAGSAGRGAPPGRIGGPRRRRSRGSAVPGQARLSGAGSRRRRAADSGRLPQPVGARRSRPVGPFAAGDPVRSGGVRVRSADRPSRGRQRRGVARAGGRGAQRPRPGASLKKGATAWSSACRRSL